MLPIIRIKSSKQLTSLMVLTYLTAIAAILNNSLPLYLRLVLLSITFMHGYSSFKHYILLSASGSVVAFGKQQLFWSLETRNNQVLHGVLHKNSFVSHFLLVLNFNCELGLKKTILLMKGSIDKEDYRRLMAHLLHVEIKHKKENIS